MTRVRGAEALIPAASRVCRRWLWHRSFDALRAIFGQAR